MIYKHRFDNKIAIITGGAQGIGFAVAERLFKEGAIVVIADIHYKKALESLAKFDSEEKCLAIAVDVSDYESTSEMVSTVINKYGKIDILINNAGITRDKIFHKMDKDMWNDVIDINLTGMYNVTRNVISYMREEKYGRIVNISSSSSYGSIGQANYAAAKAGVIGFTKTLARELAPCGITVNAVLPCFTETEMIDKMPKDVLAEIIKKIPMGRPGKPYEQAAAIAFLASDEANFITGASLDVNGGFV